MNLSFIKIKDNAKAKEDNMILIILELNIFSNLIYSLALPRIIQNIVNKNTNR